MPTISRRTFACAGLGTGLAFLLSACGSGAQATTSAATSAATTATTDASTPDSPYAAGIHHATISVRSYGDISVELNALIAPVTVTNFAELAEAHFYDGLTFHRITKDLVQGGDPTGTGKGGSGKTIMGEFAANGYPNTISHVRGTISMARNGRDYDSADSQFFICTEDNASFDGRYAAFGHVTSGMDILDALVANAKPVDDFGTIEAQDQPVIESIRMVD